MFEGLFGGGMTVREEFYLALQGDRAETAMSIHSLHQMIVAQSERIAELEKRIEALCR